MRGTVKTAAIAAAFALLSFGVLAGMAGRASSQPIKELMGDNFQNVQVMLYNLVAAQYDRLPGQIRTIHDHAVKLRNNPPDTLKSEFEQRTFTTYAYQLENNTSNMLTVLEELIQHDQQQVQSGQMNIDYLRVVAARHFGEIVTTCVLCHNQFRRHPVQ